MPNGKCSSSLLIALLVLNASLLMLTVAVHPAHAAPDPWEMPVVYVQAIPLPPTKLRVNVAIYNLTNTFYPTDDEWAPGGPLGTYAPGPVARYNYSLGNLYAFDIALRWNPAVLSYLTREKTVPQTAALPRFRSRGILHSPVIQAADEVDPVAGTCRVAYSSQAPAAAFNTPLDTANAFSLTFTVLSAGDYGLSLDSVSLVVDSIQFPEAQPTIPWRAVLDPDAAQNVGVEAAPRNKIVIGESKPFDVYALVKNTGTSSETFSVTVYAGATSIGTASATVAAGAQQTVKVTCTTMGLAKGYYSIRAVAASVAGETYPADNEVIDGTIMVTIPGDVNGDQCITIFDVVMAAGAYGASNQADPRYDPYPDVDNSYLINIFDIVMTADNYGKCWT